MSYRPPGAVHPQAMDQLQAAGLKVMFCLKDFAIPSRLAGFTNVTVREQAQEAFEAEIRRVREHPATLGYCKFAVYFFTLLSKGACVIVVTFSCRLFCRPQ